MFKYIKQSETKRSLASQTFTVGSRTQMRGNRTETKLNETIGPVNKKNAAN